MLGYLRFISKRVRVLVVRSNTQLVITTKNPNANIAATPSLCFIGICSLSTMEIGRLMT